MSRSLAYFKGRLCLCSLHNLQGPLLFESIIALLAYLGYLIDGYQKYWLRQTWGFDGELSFYYICGAPLFFALLGLSGCFITCYDRRVHNDLVQPCRELCLCCCHPGLKKTSCLECWKVEKDTKFMICCAASSRASK